MVASAPRRLSVVWLRGDPQGFKTLREVMPILEPQGIFVTSPRGGRSWLGGDVYVAPLPGSPEEAYYREFLSELRASGARLVVERDPYRAIYSAVAHPHGYYSTVAVGIDPGGRCAASAVGDGLLLWTWSGPCSGVGAAVRRAASIMPHITFSVYLGDGPGFEEAELSLVGEGLGYSVVPEQDSTVRPVSLGVLKRLLDKDVLASATIAFRGLASGI